MANHHTETTSECFSLPDSNLDTLLESDSRDPKSGLPLGVCSMLLRYLLPQLEVERYVSQRRTSIENAKKLVDIGLDGHHCLIHVTGSSVEGFSVPPYRERTPAGERDETPGRAGAPFYQMSDIDMMTEICFLPVEVRPTPGRLYIDESSVSHVGYVRLVLDGPEDTYGLSFPVRNLCKAVNESGRTVYLLSNETVKSFLARLAKSNAELTDVKVNLSGPAVNQEPKYSGQRGLDVIPDIDLVTALPLLGHPPAFHRWLERVSHGDVHWPVREIVEDIRRNSRCFVVTTGHASSSDRDLECRLSFSDPELKLAQTVTPVQRKVYLLVKLLQKCYLKEPKVIVTYHLKTAMFWLLEGSQPQDWTEETIFEQVLRFLDKLEGYLERREIPSYFYPSNNLISHAIPEHVTKTLATVRRIRDDPLRHLYGIDERVWMGFSTSATLSSLHLPVLNVVYSEGSRMRIRLKMANSLMQQARWGTIRDILWPLRCADLLRDTYDVLREEMSEQLEDKTPGTKRPVLWSSSDWLTLAMIAVFATLSQEESWWIERVTRGLERPREDKSSQDEDLFREAVSQLLPGRPHAAFVLKMLLSADGGSFVPLDGRITLKYFTLVRREKLQIAPTQLNILASSARSFRPTENQRTASTSVNEKQTCTLDPPEEVRSRSTEAVDKTEHASMDAVPRSSAGGARRKDTTRGAQRSENAAHQAPDLPRLTTEVVMPTADVQGTAVALASAYGGPPPLKTAPERLVGSMQFREVYGWCPTLIVRLHVSILEIIGHLLRQCPHLACRCAFWMHALTLRFGGWGPEAVPSVPMVDAPQFLESLPPTSGALLRRPSAKAALLPLSTFVIFTAVLADEPFRRQVAELEISDAKLATFFDLEMPFGDGEEYAYDDVVWTNVVMKLCVREMMGQDVRRCLCEVGLAMGGDKGQRAKQILMRHRL